MSKGRSTLKSFSFGSYKGVDELPDEVVGLFKDLIENPQKKAEYSFEIIDAALKGRINFDKFNLDAYEYTIRNNTRMNIEKERSKKTFIDFSSNDSERESSLRNGGMTIDTISATAIEDLTDAYDEFMNSIELQETISKIKSINDTFRVDYGINLVKLIKKAVSGYPQAIERLKEVCNEFTQVSEWVQIILGSGQPIEVLL